MKPVERQALVTIARMDNVGQPTLVPSRLADRLAKLGLVEVVSSPPWLLGLERGVRLTAAGRAAHRDVPLPVPRGYNARLDAALHPEFWRAARRKMSGSAVQP